MKTLKIRKKSGKYRVVVCPDKETKKNLKNILGEINRKSEKICNFQVVHGFMRGKSPITCAKYHIGYQYTISMDLENFFDSVNKNKVKKYLNSEELKSVLVDLSDGKGLRAAQGLPTSPAVANLGAIPLDKAILKLFEKHKKQIIYTRYADDLTFSYNNYDDKEFILNNIPHIVNRSGFKLNENKTRYMPAKAGRRVICGVSVGTNDIQATRKVRRKFRAAKFNFKKLTNENKNIISTKQSMNGLKGWIEMKEPRSIEEIRLTESKLDVIKKLRDIWKIGGIKLKFIPNTEEVYDHNFLITNDIAYKLGMSAYTTGWTSCMAPGKPHFKGIKFWLYSSSKIATILSDKTMNFNGVERRVMRARCLLHTFRNGQIAYDKMYGDQQSCNELSQYLKSKGFIHISNIKSGERIVGNIPRLKNPYFDNLKARKMIDKKRKVYILEKR